MTDVELDIAGRTYRLSCDPGQEDRLRDLARIFGQRVRDARRKSKGIGETQALLVAALALLDEHEEAKERWRQMTPEGAAAEWAASRLDEARRRLEAALDEGDRADGHADGKAER